MENTTRDSASQGDVHVQWGESKAPIAAGLPSWIQKTPGVCGGRACIRNTRITVWGLIGWKRLGLSDSRIAETIPGVTPADLQAADEYYKANQAEIDEDIKQNEEA